jgi:RNA ligase (TIGR02306 family)
MAELKVEVHRLVIEEHTNADALELAVVGGYRAVVGKGDFKTGDLAVYIPEQSIVPDWLISELGLEGRLAGRAKNRVKAVKLRGELSQGIVCKLEYVHEKGISNAIKVMGDDGEMHHHVLLEGQDVTDLLGIEKWEPTLPSSMNGKCWNAGGKTIHFDIENVKKYPTEFQNGEEVIFTEKLHGTWCCFGKNGDDYIVTSKGLSARGAALSIDEDNKSNIYVKYFLESGGKEIVDCLINIIGYANPVYVLGEIFGPVQDLKYGLNKASFRVFDIYIGDPSARGTRFGYYMDYPRMLEIVERIDQSMKDYDWESNGVEAVPVLYRGPFSEDVMNEYTDGKETVSGKQEHMREGIVMHPVLERESNKIGRLILKSVSAAYLLRKGEVTEYN